MFHFVSSSGALRTTLWGLGLTANGSAKLGPQTQHRHNEAWNEVEVDDANIDTTWDKHAETISDYLRLGPSILKSNFAILPYPSLLPRYAQIAIKCDACFEENQRKQLSWDPLRSVESHAFSIAHIHSNMLAPQERAGQNGCRTTISISKFLSRFVYLFHLVSTGNEMDSPNNIGYHLEIPAATSEAMI